MTGSTTTVTIDLIINPGQDVLEVTTLFELAFELCTVYIFQLVLGPTFVIV